MGLSIHVLYQGDRFHQYLLENWASVHMWCTKTAEQSHGMLTCLPCCLQSFTKIASEKVDQAKDAASKATTKTHGTSKSVYDSVAANLQSARDASAKQLEDTRSAADKQWAGLQKVLLPPLDLAARVLQRPTPPRAVHHVHTALQQRALVLL